MYKSYNNEDIEEMIELIDKYSIEYEDKTRGSKTFMKVSVRVLAENVDRTIELIKEIIFIMAMLIC